MRRKKATRRCLDAPLPYEAPQVHARDVARAEDDRDIVVDGGTLNFGPVRGDLRRRCITTRFIEGHDAPRWQSGEPAGTALSFQPSDLRRPGRGLRRPGSRRPDRPRERRPGLPHRHALRPLGRCEGCRPEHRVSGPRLPRQGARAQQPVPFGPRCIPTGSLARHRGAVTRTWKRGRGTRGRSMAGLPSLDQAAPPALAVAVAPDPRARTSVAPGRSSAAVAHRTSPARSTATSREASSDCGLPPLPP